MKITIRNRFTNAVIIEGEADSVREFLVKNKGADLQGANLQDADLQDADLQDADLQGADLRGAKIKVEQKEVIIKCLGLEIKE